MTANRIGVTGCCGRMGRALVAGVIASDRAVLSGGSEAPDNSKIGQDIRDPLSGEATGHQVLGNAKSLFEQSDVVIDFTRPAASLDHARLAAETGKPLILGTTGLTADQEKAVAGFARRAAVVYAANFSLGVNLLLSLVEKAAATLDKGFDIEILEMHHCHKVDAPSGTALALGKAAAAGRGVDFDAAKILSREGIGDERPVGAIGFAALRGGDVAGEHSVIFAGPGERIELAHKAADRAIFAHGAVRAALWVRDKPAGLYSMKDVLGL